MDRREALTRLFHAGVRGADPYRATRDALDAPALGARTWVLAVGKAGAAMARGALDAMADARRLPCGGLVIAAGPSEHTTAPLPLVIGDHPTPGDGSQDAADALGDVVRRVHPGDDVLVLLSGGASALMAAPVGGVSREALHTLFGGLHRSGAPIGTMNAFRKRILRWGGGRLAAALSGARVQVLIASDVIGNDIAAIGSGPCAPDPRDAAELEALAERERLWPFVPDDVRDYLRETRAGRRPETPKGGDPAFRTVSSRIVLDNGTALAAVASAAAEAGFAPVHVAPAAVEGEAQATGEAIALAALATLAARPDSLGTAPALLAWGGETTVRLGALPHGTGGRAQELALAAARALRDAGDGWAPITILAAGTDGRDGPTDAAGGVVDATTWDRITRAGRDPAADLKSHDAYHALDAAGALLRTGLTGTNVNDLVLVAVGA